jgi:hypothetical protein
MPSSKQTDPPAGNDRFDAEVYRVLNEKDPRALGGGPCEDKHLKVQIGAETEPSAVLFHGNQSARWMDCAKCGLRMGTYPLNDNGRKSVVVLDPVIVEEALTRIKDIGMWNDCNKKLVDGMIKIIQGERQVSAACTHKEVRASRLPLFKPANFRNQYAQSSTEQSKVKKEVEAEKSSGSTSKTVQVKITMVVCQLCNEEGHGAPDCYLLNAQFEHNEED